MTCTEPWKNSFHFLFIKKV